MELELEIQQQMEINPLLEESIEIDEELEEETKKDDESKSLEDHQSSEDFEEAKTFDTLLEDSFDQNSYNNEQTEYDPNWEQDREPQENRITTMPPLTDQLYDQLKITELEGQDVEIANFIIGNIDDRGYLTCSTHDIAEAIQLPEGEVERVLEVIQTFDPPGIGARDLRECLIIQLEQQTNNKGAVIALQMVRNHMDDLTRRRFSRITRAMGISNNDLKIAMDVVEKLQPNPGTTSTSDYSGPVSYTHLRAHETDS